MAAPAPLARAPRSSLAVLEGICFDIDDTFTTGGRVEPVAFSALWKAHDAGLVMIPVTGRPAGWCDHLCRMWPVQGVVGENGAFYFSYDRGRRRVVRRWAQSRGERARGRERLEAVRERVLEEVRGSRVAGDQAYREADLAIDFAEDVRPLSAGKVDRIAEIFAEHGAQAKVSSIHVNGWFGRYDKRTMLMRLLRERLGRNERTARRRFAYIGDSPNDASLFDAFEFSVGVANVRDHLASMSTAPRYVTRGRGGDGFAEFVRAVLRARTSR